MRERLIPFLTFISRPAIALTGALVLGGALVGFAWYATSVAPSGSFVPVVRGALHQEVDVTGVVKAAHSTDLAFQTSGRVADINVAVGDHVFAGQTLAALDRSSQAASVALARANLEVAEAKYAALSSGTRPEQLAIDETNVTQADIALASALAAAYTNADDAVHAKADQLFNNPRSSNVQLAITVPDATLTNRLQQERVALELLVTAWDSADTAEADLQTISAFLNDLTNALALAQSSGSLAPALLAGYQTSVNQGRVNVAAARSAVIAANTSFTAARGALALAEAGATQNDLDAQQAAVDAASAGLDAASAAASQAVIIAPVAGTITVQNADLGETVVPGVPLVSMVADGKYQADAQISEADIAKVKSGDAVVATFAAYPGATFAAMVTTVDVAASSVSGIASYPVTVTFADDARLRPGLSAELRISTATEADALLVPTSAVITDGEQKFVYVQGAKGAVRTPVTLGLAGATTTEIVSGLATGDRVLSFGATAAK